MGSGHCRWTTDEGVLLPGGLDGQLKRGYLLIWEVLVI